MNSTVKNTTFRQITRETFPAEFESPAHGVSLDDLFDAAQGISGPQTRNLIRQLCQENPGLAAGYLESRKEFQVVRKVQEDGTGIYRLWLKLSGRLSKDSVLFRQLHESDERKKALHGETVRKSSAWTWSAVTSLACAWFALFVIAPRLIQSKPEWIGVRGIGDHIPPHTNNVDALTALKYVQDPQRDIVLVISELELQLGEEPSNQNNKDLLIYFYRLAESKKYESILDVNDRIAYRAKREQLEKKP